MNTRKRVSHVTEYFSNTCQNSNFSFLSSSGKVSLLVCKLSRTVKDYKAIFKFKAIIFHGNILRGPQHKRTLSFYTFNNYYLPDLVTIISVPNRWNLCHNSWSSRVTFISLFLVSVAEPTACEEMTAESTCVEGFVPLLGLELYLPSTNIIE